MSTTNLGRILIMNKGEWSASTAYQPLDVVTINNAKTSYICKVANTGVNPATDPTKWDLWVDVSDVYTKTETNSLLNTKVDSALIGAHNGIAQLDAAGKVPSSQLPSYVDDIIEGYYYEEAFYSDAEHTQELSPELGKIYVDLESNYTYRWSGTVYVQVGGEEQIQSDWEQSNDEAVDYVKNRPFYEDIIPDPSVETPIDIIPNIEGINSGLFNYGELLEDGYHFEEYDPIHIPAKNLFDEINKSYICYLEESGVSNVYCLPIYSDYKELGYLSFSSSSVLNVGAVDPESYNITPLTTISYDETNDCYGDISIWNYWNESGEVPSQEGLCIKVNSGMTYILVYGDIGLSDSCLAISCEESQTYGATVNCFNNLYFIGYDMSALTESSGISITIGENVYDNITVQKKDISGSYGEGSYGVALGNPALLPEYNSIFNFEPTEDSFAIIYFNLSAFGQESMVLGFEYEEITDEELFFKCSLDDAMISDLKQIDAKFIPTIPMNYLNFKDSYFTGIDSSSIYSRFNVIHLQGSVEEIKQKYNASISTDRWFDISTTILPDNYQYDAFKKLLRAEKNTQCWFRFKIIDNNDEVYEYETDNNGACIGMTITPHPFMPQFLTVQTRLYLEDETDTDIYLMMAAQSSNVYELNISDTCIVFNARISSDLTLPDPLNIKELYFDVEVAPNAKYFGGVPLCLIDGTDNYIADWDSISNYINFIKNKPFDVVVNEQTISSLQYNSDFSAEVQHNCFTHSGSIYSVNSNFVAPDTKRMYFSYSYVDRYGWDAQTTYYNYFTTDSTIVKVPIYYTNRDNLYYPLLVSADGEDYYVNETVEDNSNIFICERVFYYSNEYVKIRGYDSLQDFPAIEQTNDLFVAKDTSLVYHISNNQYVQYLTLAQMEESDRLVYKFICIISNDSLDTESTQFGNSVTYGLTDLPADRLMLGNGLEPDENKALKVKPEDFIDGTTITYDSTTEKISADLTDYRTSAAQDIIDATKQGTLTAGANITIDANNEISATDTIYDDTVLSGRVTTLEGLVDSHTIRSNVPAGAVFTDTTYTAGTNITINANNEISATVPSITASTTDLQDGVSPLATGALYLVYEV